MNLRNHHREAMIQALTLAVDSCIQAEADRGLSSDQTPLIFKAQIEITFENTSMRIVSAPALDFRKDIRAQLQTGSAREVQPTSFKLDEL